MPKPPNLAPLTVEEQCFKFQLMIYNRMWDGWNCTVWTRTKEYMRIELEIAVIMNYRVKSLFCSQIFSENCWFTDLFSAVERWRPSCRQEPAKFLTDWFLCNSSRTAICARRRCFLHSGKTRENDQRHHAQSHPINSSWSQSLFRSTYPINSQGQSQ